VKKTHPVAPAVLSPDRAGDVCNLILPVTSEDLLIFWSQRRETLMPERENLKQTIQALLTSEGKDKGN
jgi:hypothetical protein